MDLDKILHFVPSHIEQIIAVLGALFLVTTILLLVRSLKEKSNDANEGIDVRTIEGALKRVLAQNPPTVVEKTVVAGGDDNPAAIADLAPLKTALAEKEKQLALLNAELTEAKAAAAAAANSNGGAAAGEVAGSATAVAGLEMEISDLKARLAEYEIIEDDIADLALYKEENARLKREIEEARAQDASSGATQAAQDVQITAPPIIEANPAAGIPGLTEALQEEAAAAPVQAQAPTPPITEPTPAAIVPEVEPEFDPLAELLANAPQVTVGDEVSTGDDPLGALDTDKMLAEAENLAGAPADDKEINALSDLLDTDKLLEEVNSLDAQDVMSEFKDKSKLG